MTRSIIRPAKIVKEDGAIEWRLNGKLHRLDGPAIEHPNGSKEWYFMGKLHREDGPAVIGSGKKIYYLEGELIPEPVYLTINASKYKKLQVYQIMHS